MKPFTAKELAIGSAALIIGWGVLLNGCTPTKGIKPAAATTPVAAEQPTPPAETVPDGWQSTGTPGVYVRGCTNDPECSDDAVIGDNSYVLYQIWCKERACGDIYARVNLLNSAGVVVGWTNDTAYGDIGQKVQLTFDSYQEGWSRASITELNFRI